MTDTKALAPPAEKPRTAMQVKQDSIKALLTGADTMKAIKDVIPKHLNAETLTRIAIVTINKAPKLLDCTQISVLECFISASELGLSVGPYGGANLVPFGNKCTLVVDYLGKVDLMRRSDKIESIEARCVYTFDDEFVIEFGIERKFIHRPSLDHAPDPKKLRGAYCIVRFEGGGYQMEWMNIAEIHLHRDRSPAYQTAVKYNKTDTPWITDEPEMCKKTLIHAVFKLCPKAVDLASRMAQVDASFDRDFGSAMPAIDLAAGLTEGRTDTRADKTASGADIIGEDDPSPEPAADAGKSKPTNGRRTHGKSHLKADIVKAFTDGLTADVADACEGIITYPQAETLVADFLIEKEYDDDNKLADGPTQNIIKSTAKREDWKDRAKDAFAGDGSE